MHARGAGGVRQLQVQADQVGRAVLAHGIWLDDADRRSLLLGKPLAGEDPGRAVCACFGVGVNTLRQAIRDGQLGSVEAIGEALRAGTNCGSCIPELQSLLAERG